MWITTSGYCMEGCESAPHPYDSFFVESLAAPVVALLNERGYSTRFSCEGHIAFDYYMESIDDITQHRTGGLPYVVIRDNTILNVDNDEGLNKIAEITYHKLIWMEDVDGEMIHASDIENEYTRQEILEMKREDPSMEFSLGIYLNVDFENIHRDNVYDFYKQTVDKWDGLYKYLLDHLREPIIL